MDDMPQKLRTSLQSLTAEEMAQVSGQRAHDLIDRNEGETDPRRAIRRLHRALRYARLGRSQYNSLQAAKAYQDLGMYYEQLGNVSRAIMYYTKAIELRDALGIKPIPALYWRGELLAHRGEREAARRDLERALALDEQPTYFAEGREFAECYLTEQTR